MSNFRAIGGVSASLRNLLRDRMEDPVDVSIAPPDVTISNVSAKRLNLYLYQVTENGHVKNQEIPGHGHSGAYGHPPLSLDLHYLLTAYSGDETGIDSDLEAQEILGDAMRVLHDLPFVTDKLEITRSSVGTVGAPILDNSLLGGFERVKITLQPMTLEDLSKIWTALPETNFRRSVAYQVSVVQIESQRPRRFPKPVGEPPLAGPRVFTVPFRSPQISSDIRVRRLGDQPDVERPFAYARIGDTQIIRGRNLAGANTRVMLGDVDATNQIRPSRQDDRIEVTIPDDAALQPGPQPVKVVLNVMMGEPPSPHLGFQSNLAVFMLVPKISSLTLDRDALPNARTRTLEIQGERLFLDTLSGQTLVGPALIPKTAYHASQPTKITILPDTLPAWPVRCLVSGDLSSFPNLPSAPEMQMTIGSDGPRRVAFRSRPTTLPDAARALQDAISGASGGGAAFKGARVTTADNRLVVVPGGLGNNITVAAGDVANQLKLIGGTTSQGYLSGELTPSPRLTSSSPAVTLTLGGTTNTVTLTTLAAARPKTAQEAAPLLQTDIRNAGFSNVQVTTLENQLLILPGAPGTVTFDKVTGTDETTVAELQLRARYPVRVRVNGAESIDEKDLEFP